MPKYLLKHLLIQTFHYQGRYLYFTPALLFFMFVPFNISWNSYGNQTSLLNNPLISQSIAHAKDLPKPDQSDWHIRLSIEMPSEGLKDSMNTLGISSKSSIGRDLLDIVDQPRPSWVKNYLDLVFPHPEWEGDLTDLSSDFHGDDPQKTKVESWYFEVRSNMLNKEAVFAWHGPKNILGQCQLRDGRTGKLLVSDPMREGYAFTLSEPVRSFIWEYTY